jgi:predicted nucleic acid-binding protein
MKVVLDASVAMALILEQNPYTREAEEKMEFWQDERVQVVAPSLWIYEITSALHKLVKFEQLPFEEAHELLQDLLALGVQLIHPTEALASAAFFWAERLEQAAAYDAVYLALAEQEGADFWTGDRRLANNAQQRGLSWVHHLEEP